MSSNKSAKPVSLIGGTHCQSEIHLFRTDRFGPAGRPASQRGRPTNWWSVIELNSPVNTTETPHSEPVAQIEAVANKPAAGARSTKNKRCVNPGGRVPTSNNGPGRPPGPGPQEPRGPHKGPAHKGPWGSTRAMGGPTRARPTRAQWGPQGPREANTGLE